MKKLFRFFLILFAAAILVGGYARFIEPNLLRVSRQKVSTAGKTEPLTAVFFTDTHFGSQYSPRNLAKIAEKINAQNPDLVFFGGDFFDAYWQDADLLDLDMIAEELSKIQAPLGKYAVWGNHDRGGGAFRVYESVLAKGGFTVLSNQWVPVPDNDLTIAGVDDALLGSPSLNLEGAPPEAFTILLSHEPDLIAELPMEGIDLVLSGHSHGGQVTLPFLTEKILPPGSQRFYKGWYAWGQADLFVSSGIGTTKLPVRLGNVPEIYVLELTP